MGTDGKKFHIAKNFKGILREVIQKISPNLSGLHPGLELISIIIM